MLSVQHRDIAVSHQEDARLFGRFEETGNLGVLEAIALVQDKPDLVHPGEHVLQPVGLEQLAELEDFRFHEDFRLSSGFILKRFFPVQR